MSETPFNQEQAIEQYTDLMHIVQVGAYTENSEDGSYWYGDTNISESIDNLDFKAAQAGLKFVGSKDGPYELSPMTEQEKAEFKAQERAEREEEARQLRIANGMEQ